MSGVEGTQTKLTHEQVDQALLMERGWRREGEAIVRELKLRDFDEALRFIERVAQLANDYGRRPDMCISEFNRVRITIANPHHAGITDAERRLAAKVDAAMGDVE